MSDRRDALLNTLWEIPWWEVEDSDGLANIDIGLDLLATEIIKAKLVDQKYMKRVTKFSEVLGVLHDKSDFCEDLVASAVALEGYLSLVSYGTYSEEAIERAGSVAEGLCTELENWFEEIDDAEE